MSKPRVTKGKIAVLVGSESDLSVTKSGVEILETLNIPYEIHIYSAHRTPEVTLKFAKSAQRKGFGVMIVGAGMAAHLAGVVAAHTLLPVIGVPIDSKLEGLDALLSTVQMPAGIPVACVTIGRTGFINAALLAAQILSLKDRGLQERLKNMRIQMTKDVLKADRKLRQNQKEET